MYFYAESFFSEFSVYEDYHRSGNIVIEWNRTSGRYQNLEWIQFMFRFILAMM